jgi:aspartate 4-decarboxylase
MVKTLKKYKKQRKHTRKKSKSIQSINNKYTKYEELSPFELKNILIQKAKKSKQKFLNAGRGNPNFFNSLVRECFTIIQNACVNLSELQKISSTNTSDLSVYPEYQPKVNYRSLLEKSIRKVGNLKKKHNDFIHYYLDLLEKRDTKQSSNFIIYDMILSSLGTFYPSPPRIQPHNEKIVDMYMRDLVFSTKKKQNEERDQYEYFAVEGAAAGIMYVFDSLYHNGLLEKNDTIAIITPIFSPYLELPKLTHYGLKIVELKGEPNNEYALSKDTMDKLKNRKIKALFMVNPGNPTEYSLPRSNIDYIGRLVNTVRRDLIVISDCVYSPFVKQFNSLMETCPKNTIEIFSLSKYFGVTGMRLGVVMIRKNNNIQKLFANLSKTKKEELNRDYSIMSKAPEKMTFMERLVADSRQIAEAHVGGLSGPQQVIMSMFMTYSFYDEQPQKNKYRNSIRELLIRRMNNTYSKLGYTPKIDAKSTNYYTLVDILQVTEILYGTNAVSKMKKINYIQFLFHLAKKYGVVLLPGKGFGATKWRIRISLANLKTEDYTIISHSLRECIHDFVK